MSLAIWMHEQMRHSYEADVNILKYWFPKGIELRSRDRIDAYFRYGLTCTKACPCKPYLLVDYSQVHLDPIHAPYYAEAILAMKDSVLDVYRFGVGVGDPDRVHISASVRVATPQGYGRSNFYRDEASARAAILQAQGRRNGDARSSKL